VKEKKSVKAEKAKKSAKKSTLYWKIIIPSVVVTLIGCFAVIFALSNGVEKSMIAINKDNLTVNLKNIQNDLHRERRNLEYTVAFAGEEIGNRNIREPELPAVAENLVDDFNLYGAAVLSKSGTILTKSGNFSDRLSDAEKMIFKTAAGGRSDSAISVKGEEVLNVCATPLGDYVLIAEKDITNVELLEKYGGLCNIVVTIFIDDLRVETTIKDANGNYLKGTRLNNDTIYNQVYVNKDVFYGNNVINGQRYVTIYSPYENDENVKVMLFIGISLNQIDSISSEVSGSIMPVVMAVIILVILIIILAIALFLMKPLKHTVRAFDSLNGGTGVADLTLRIRQKSNDEIGEMSSSINTFINTQQNLLLEVDHATDELQSVGEELASSSQQSASAIAEIMANIQSVKRSVVNQTDALVGVQKALQSNIDNIESLDKLIENQSAGITQSSASIEEMVGNISSVTSNVSKMAEEFKVLMQITTEGRERQNEVATQVSNMAEQSQHLADANNVISQIASQTNLLAMNAAIEAAHAGEAGKGFSVVADEIRKLAEDSARQTKAIKAELSGISKIIEEVVATSENSVRGFAEITSKVSSTEELVSQIDGAMEEQEEASQQVLVALREINESTAEVKTTSKEMSAGIEQVTTAVNNLDMIAQTVAGSMEEMSAGATEINNAAQSVSEMATKTNDNIHSLESILGKFKLQNDAEESSESVDSDSTKETSVEETENIEGGDADSNASEEAPLN